MRKAKRENQQEDSGPLSGPEKVAQFWPGPNSEIENRVASMLLDSWSPRQIAKQLNVPYGEFLKWYMDRGVQAYLMVKRNDLAEERRRNAEKDTE